jgi:hypothetical protein
VTIKYTSIFHSKALPNAPKLGFLVWKQTLWQPWHTCQTRSLSEPKNVLWKATLPSRGKQANHGHAEAASSQAWVKSCHVCDAFFSSRADAATCGRPNRSGKADGVAQIGTKKNPHMTCVHPTPPPLSPSLPPRHMFWKTCSAQKCPGLMFFLLLYSKRVPPHPFRAAS